ncbi:unnamed protein product [Somion occarium]|uniref:Uncharacterized protein n=1 Tax=Somion occarium TaxID=3059160 RepID=A0ABP1CEM4_9APHY
MGNDISKARSLALSSFLVNFATQTYGMLTSPNMKEVADANHFAFSPNPWFIAAFFSGQAVLQLYWIRQLFLLPPNGYKPLTTGPASESTALRNDDKVLDDQAAIDATVNYVPIFALGNLCIAGWLYFWLQEDFITSQVFVTINTFAQLYAVARLPPVTRSSPALLHITNLVANTFAGIGVLDFIDNGGVALQYRATPSTIVQALTYGLFPIAAAVSTPLFGSILAYDLVALWAGQRFGGGTRTNEWGNGLGLTALIVSGIAAIKGLRPLSAKLWQKRRDEQPRDT